MTTIVIELKSESHDKEMAAKIIEMLNEEVARGRKR